MHARHVLVPAFAGVLAVVATAAPAVARTRVLGSKGAVLSVPAQPVTRELGPDQGCQTLLDTGNGSCAVARSAHGDLVFTLEATKPPKGVIVSRPWVVRVYRKSATVPNGWEVGLETRAEGGEPGPLYANVTAKLADVTGDGRDELLLGYRSEGTGQILDLDIVGTDPTGAPKVLAHEQLYKGTVVVGHDRLVTYSPVYRKRDPNCCPTWIERDVVRYRNGAFVVAPGPRTPTRKAHEPPGDLG